MPDTPSLRNEVAIAQGRVDAMMRGNRDDVVVRRLSEDLESIAAHIDALTAAHKKALGWHHRQMMTSARNCSFCWNHRGEPHDA